MKKSISNCFVFDIAVSKGFNGFFDDEQVANQLSEAWEHDNGKDEVNVVLQGLEQHVWRGTEAG